MDYLEVTQQKNFLEFKSDTSTYVVPIGVANGITAYTNDEKETYELINYLHDRVEDYDGRFSFSPLFVEGLFTSLLELGFAPVQLMEGLDQFKGYELFGDTQNEDGKAVSISERIATIVMKVNAALERQYQYTAEQLEDEPKYHGKI